AVLGASETFGMYESPGKDFPAQMQAMLDEAEPGRYQVLNVGCAGMTFPRFTHYFDVWVSRFDPDVVAVYPTPASYLAVEPPASRIEPGTGPPEKLPENLRLARKTKALLRRFLPASWQAWWRRRALAELVEQQGGESWLWHEAPPERVRLFREHLEQLVDTVERSGARVVLATHTNRFPADREKWTTADRLHMVRWRQAYGRPSADGLLDMEREANRVVREVAREHGAAVADVAAAVPPMSKPPPGPGEKPKPHFADFAHFTDAGARLAAGAFVEKIVSRSAR
ncbi:MAG: hypothetical protein ACOC70_01915, partial [bacterium]